MNKWTKFVTYINGSVRIEFHPMQHPSAGFSHRVRIVCGSRLLASDWLSDTHNPTAKAAQYFYEKHEASISAR